MMTLTHPKLLTLQAAFEKQLLHYLPSNDTAPERLHQAMRYVVLGKAKRVRPLLLYATCLSFNANPEHAHTAAVAIEVLHTYSLVHDDLPAMDNDDLRRGQATCHKAYDEATAILVGDALQNLAFELLSQPNAAWDPITQLTMIHTLAEATGSQGMIGGQMLDMQYEGKIIESSAIDHMHALKTGRLIRASVMIGALIAKLSEKERAVLQQIADSLGLAFQLKDDLLDLTGNAKTLGKTGQRDLARQKASALKAEQLDAVKQRLRSLEQYALELLNCFPQDTSALAAMVKFIGQRDS